jgi:hypothetical protein
VPRAKHYFRRAWIPQFDSEEPGQLLLGVSQDCPHDNGAFPHCRIGLIEAKNLKPAITAKFQIEDNQVRVRFIATDTSSR